MRKGLLMLVAFVAAVLGTVVIQPAPVSASVPCWTSFDPGSPQGGSMTQYYHNCGTSTSTVMPYFYSSTNKITYIYNNECKTVGPGATVSWYHPWTYSNVQYSTAMCVAGPASSGAYKDYYTTSYPCGTSFTPSSPQGAAMTQRYANCYSQSDISWSSGYQTSNGNFYAAAGDCVAVPGYTESYRGIGYWNYTSTVPGANYRTVWCMGSMGSTG
jgi:hypothetical protein